ncbi:ABC transporter permease [Bulleidia sp. zg-1006]|uniref:ABC transporter permease n=1 Tax=Bulleidia sp. zg-1006 TaxID=2806552 RepID=UPI0019394DAB|nr:ABC transporter permease [Bulleidia sp. zg-1006]QRG86246.1 ABC transporter permease [Bulleidia sp. zg-1006]
MNKKRSLMFNVVRGAMAIGIALLVAAVFIFISSKGDSLGEKLSSTFSALSTMLFRPLFKVDGSFSVKSFTDILASMIPIIFTGLATCVMFSANQFNLGSEGGILLGAFVTSLIAVYVPLPGALLPIVAILAGTLVTGLMMLIPAVFKAKLNVSEMVNSLMLNYVIMYIIKFLMNTFIADKTKGTVQTANFQTNALLPQLIDNGSKLSIGFVVAIVMVILITLFMYRTRWGYAVRMIGINKEFSMYSGLNVAFIIILTQVVGGLLAGMGGGIEMLGKNIYFDWTTLPGYGWTGVTVAILAGNNPAFTPLAAFFIAYLAKGCTLMSTYTSVPAQLIDIIQATIFLFFAANQFLAKYRQRLVVKSAEEELKEKLISEGGKQ